MDNMCFMDIPFIDRKYQSA